MLPFDFKVGRNCGRGEPYKGLFDADTPEDKEIIRSALARLGIEEMAKEIFCIYPVVKSRGF